MKTYETIKVNLNDIKPYDRNARVHSSEQIAQIMVSIKEFGFTNPILIDSDRNLIAGHGRLEALKQLNKVEYLDNPIVEVPAVLVEGLSETQRRALIIADNKIAENATWDLELLKEEIEELEYSNYDVEMLGIDIAQFEDSMTERLSEDKEVDVSDFNETIEFKVQMGIDNFRKLNSTLNDIDGNTERALMELVKSYEK